MRVVIALLLLLVAAPLARADEGKPEKELRPTVVQPAAERPTASELVLEQVTIPEGASAEAQALEAQIAATETTASQEMPRRGSFWWMVGVIVVAGIILAVVLD